MIAINAQLLTYKPIRFWAYIRFYSNKGSFIPYMLLDIRNRNSLLIRFWKLDAARNNYPRDTEASFELLIERACRYLLPLHSHFVEICSTAAIQITLKYYIIIILLLTFI